MTRRAAPFENLRFVPPGHVRSDDGSALSLVAKSAGMAGPEARSERRHTESLLAHPARSRRPRIAGAEKRGVVRLAPGTRT
jgi:hypothetical protein